MEGWEGRTGQGAVNWDRLARGQHMGSRVRAVKYAGPSGNGPWSTSLCACTAVLLVSAVQGAANRWPPWLHPSDHFTRLHVRRGLPIGAACTGL